MAVTAHPHGRHAPAEQTLRLPTARSASEAIGVVREVRPVLHGTPLSSIGACDCRGGAHDIPAEMMYDIIYAVHAERCVPARIWLMRASRRGTRLHTLRMTAVPKGAYTVLCGSCTGHVCRSGRCHRATAAHIRHACSCRASLPRRAVRGSRRWMRPVWASPRRYRSNGSQMCLTTGPCGMWWSKRRWYARHAHRRMR